MSIKRVWAFAIVLLVFFWLATFSGKASADPGPGAQPTWAKVSDGFEDPHNLSIESLITFGDYLYAGTYKDPFQFEGCELWRSDDGTTWEQVNSDGFGNENNIRIASMAVFDGYLYVGTSGGKIWRSSNGTNWSQANENGFGNENNIYITSMAVFDGYLYAGTSNYGTGAEIWRTSDGTTWNQVLYYGFANENNTRVDSMVAFNGYLYAGVANSNTGARIWRTPGGDAPGWSVDVYPYGFGDENNYTIGWLGTFLGPFASERLYAGVCNPHSGCQVRWRSGGSWTQINDNGFGDGNNTLTESFAILNDELYVGTKNLSDGAELWKYDGSTWEQVNSNGFGDVNNKEISSMATFGPIPTTKLYVGTYNTQLDTAQLWMTPLDIPTLVPMTDPTDSDTFNFDWSDVTGADRYHIQLDDNPEFSSPFEAYPSGSYYNYGPTGYDDGTYFWRVSARDVFENETDFSATDNFTLDTQSPSIPDLISPPNDSATTDHTPTFDWTDSTDLSNFTYQLVVDDDPDCLSPVIDNSELTASTYTPGSNLSDDNYYWKVRAEDELGHQSDWSSTWHFEVYTAPGVNQPPTANFSYSPSSPNVGQTIQFTDESTDPDGTIENWSWNFGDETTSALQNPTHSYTHSETYTVTLTVTDNGGATDTISHSVEVSPVTLSAPSLISPPNDTITNDNTPTFDWSDVTNAENYWLQIDNNTDFSSPIIDYPGLLASIYVAGDGLPDDDYYWRALAEGGGIKSDWSPIWHLEINSSALSAPALISPSDGTATNDNSPTFSWESVLGAEGYTLQLDNENAFTLPLIYENMGLTNTTLVLPDENQLPDGIYYWRVRGENSEVPAIWSAFWSLTVDTVAPAVPSLTEYTPDPTEDPTPTLDWSDVPDATGYHILIDDNPDFSSPIVDDTITENTYTPASDLPEGKIYWKVSAIDEASNESSFSTADDFTLTKPAEEELNILLIVAAIVAVCVVAGVIIWISHRPKRARGIQRKSFPGA